ncbi:MAG TPA: hypothetical protein PKA06_10225 [Gemmatales bacterium]|nr:hypothetical protein [Gemmatales bacterium]
MKMIGVRSPCSTTSTRLTLIFGDGCADKNFITHYYGGRPGHARNLNLPENIFLLVPFQRNAFAISKPITARPAKTGPIFRLG